MDKPAASCHNRHYDHQKNTNHSPFPVPPPPGSSHSNKKIAATKENVLLTQVKSMPEAVKNTFFAHAA
jgi:hypothetical protein